jgi:hypothetical protein
MQHGDATKTAEPVYLHQSKDGTTVITRECLFALTSGEREFDVLCKDSEDGILPFLVAEDGSTFEDFFGVDDEDEVAHIEPKLPLPLHFGLTDDYSYVELSPCGPNGAYLLQRFNWCVFTPFEDDPKGGKYELRFATTSIEDAQFMATTLGCVDLLMVPVVDETIEVV